MNLNLVRNHIRYSKRQIEDHCKITGLDLPEMYFKSTPEEVDIEHMVNKEEIQKQAIISLRKLKESEDYKYLIDIMYKLNEKGMEKINTALSSINDLHMAIHENNYIKMRRHINNNAWQLERLKTARESLDLEGFNSEEQLSFFDMSKNEDDMRYRRLVCSGGGNLPWGRGDKI